MAAKWINIQNILILRSSITGVKSRVTMFGNRVLDIETSFPKYWRIGKQSNPDGIGRVTETLHFQNVDACLKWEKYLVKIAEENVDNGFARLRNDE